LFLKVFVVVLRIFSSSILGLNGALSNICWCYCVAIADSVAFVYDFYDTAVVC